MCVTVEKLKEERALLLAELGTLPHMLHGSWVERFSVCSRKDCRCQRGERHGPRHYLVVRENGKQRQKYVPNSQVDAALTGLAEHKRVREIVDRITQINLQLGTVKFSMKEPKAEMQSEMEQACIHVLVVIRDAQTDHPLILYRCPELLFQPLAVTRFHHKHNIGPLYIFCRQLNLSIISQTGRTH